MEEWNAPLREWDPASSDASLRCLYTNDGASIDRWIADEVEKDGSGFRVDHIGLDVEWRPSFRPGPCRPAAVLQLSTGRTALICHIFHVTHVPDSLRRVLGDASLFKSGVGVLDDARKLFLDYGIVVAGCVDPAAVMLHRRWEAPHGLSLRALAQQWLAMPTWKNKRVTLSNWEAAPLSHKQQIYAALDAWVGWRLFHVMQLGGAQAVRGAAEVFSVEEATRPDSKPNSSSQKKQSAQRKRRRDRSRSPPAKRKRVGLCDT